MSSGRHQVLVTDPILGGMIDHAKSRSPEDAAT
jgi:hypothetical protein